MSAVKHQVDVLVVDDEESMREFLEVIIDNEGLSCRLMGSLIGPDVRRIVAPGNSTTGRRRAIRRTRGCLALFAPSNRSLFLQLPHL